MTITSAFGGIHCSTASPMAGQLILSLCASDSVRVRSRVEVFGGALQEKVGSPPLTRSLWPRAAFVPVMASQ